MKSKKAILWSSILFFVFVVIILGIALSEPESKFAIGVLSFAGLFAAFTWLSTAAMCSEDSKARSGSRWVAWGAWLLAYFFGGVGGLIYYFSIAKQEELNIFTATMQMSDGARKMKMWFHIIMGILIAVFTIITFTLDQLTMIPFFLAFFFIINTYMMIKLMRK